jgi:hypothetical protein
MIDAHDREQWEHTSHMLAQLWEVCRPIRQWLCKDKVPALKPSDYNPFDLMMKKKAKRESFKAQIASMASAYAIPRKEVPNG